MRYTGEFAEFTPNYELLDYELVVVPDDSTHDCIRSEQEFFRETFMKEGHCKENLHITIARFQAKEIMEETLVRWIQNICMLHNSFDVRLNNFSSFPPHTIYLRIIDPMPFIHIGNQLKMISGFIESNNCPPLTLSPRPHLALVSGLSERIYNQAVREYAQRCFSHNFRVEKLVLLKKEGNYGNCQVVRSFRLATSPSVE